MTERGGPAGAASAFVNGGVVIGPDQSGPGVALDARDQLAGSSFAMYNARSIGTIESTNVARSIVQSSVTGIEAGGSPRCGYVSVVGEFGDITALLVQDCL